MGFNPLRTEPIRKRTRHVGSADLPLVGAPSAFGMDDIAQAASMAPSAPTTMPQSGTLAPSGGGDYAARARAWTQASGGSYGAAARAWTNASRGGGNLGAVPNHPGWQGMRPEAQQWTRRALGQFQGIRFSSGFRDPAHNARIGGAKNSKHMSGLATDFSGPNATLDKLAAWGRQQGFKVIWQSPGHYDHVHISWIK